MIKEQTKCLLLSCIFISWSCLTPKETTAQVVDSTLKDSKELERSKEKLKSVMKVPDHLKSRMDYFSRFENKIIRKITVSTQLSKFGVSNSKPRYVKLGAKAGLKIAEALHVNTRRKRIYDFLLIEVGDKILAQNLVEAERVLRSNRFMDDAIFVINEGTITDEFVDIFITTKDVFSLKPELNFFNFSKYTIGLVEGNFLGQANTFGVNIHRDVESLAKIRPAIRYTLNSPFGNYINFSGSYNSFGRSLTSSRRSENSLVFGAERSYLTNLFRWQGGVYLGLYSNYDYFNDTLFSTKSKYKYSLVDGWIGLNNYKLSLFNLLEKEWSILYTARVTSRYFYQKPKFLEESYFYNVVDNTNILLQASLFRRSFYRFTHLFDLGRAEDVETGRLVSLTGGYAGRNKNPGFYASSEFQLTEHLGADNYINLKFSIGGFFNNKAFYDGTALLYAIFIPRKKDLGNTYWRNYFSIAYSQLIKQRYTPLLNGQGQWGLFDYGRTIMSGNKRVTIRYESLLFIKEKILGFNLAPLFTSQWLYVHRDDEGSNEVHSILGLGARFRNRKWIANSVEVKLYMYPRLIGDGSFVGFSIGSAFDLRGSISLLHRPEFITL